MIGKRMIKNLTRIFFFLFFHRELCMLPFSKLAEFQGINEKIYLIDRVIKAKINKQMYRIFSNSTLIFALTVNRNLRETRFLRALTLFSLIMHRSKLSFEPPNENYSIGGFKDFNQFFLSQDSGEGVLLKKMR